MHRCPVHSGDEENAEDRSHCVHQGHEVTLLQSCLNFKDHGDHQETHGKEELTKGVVLKHIVGSNDSRARTTLTRLTIMDNS